MYTTLISTRALLSNSNNPDWVILDCRFSLADTSQGENHFAQSRIPGAQYAHLDKHLSGPVIAGKTGRHPLPDKNQLLTQFQRWGISNRTQIVAYDDSHGAMASRLWWLSRWLGHEACAVLDGGFAAWKNAAFELETTAVDQQPSEKPPSNKPLPNQQANHAQIQPGTPLVHTIEKDQLISPMHCLLDAREAERYAGEKEPIDAVAGRIPGALNAPFLANLNADHTFKSGAVLHDQYAPVLQAAEGKKLVHYCGSGVTAAHNILAMTHAGLAAGDMYAGSFSEWIADANFEKYPIEKD